jgi:hypothetical protein
MGKKGCHVKNKIIAGLAVAVALIVHLAGCSAGSSSSGNEKVSASSVAASSSFMSQTGGIADYDMVEEAVDDYVEMEDAIEEPAMDGPAESSSSIEAVSVSSNRMIITTVNLHMQTTAFDQGITEMEAIVASFDGFMQDSYVEGMNMFEENGTRSASFTARIPSARLDDFVDSVGGSFQITNKQQSGEDITDSYHDNEARLNSLRIQEERLLAMLESAEELQYLIEVQRELSDVQYQIDSYTASKLRMENQVAMSTVYLYLNEVVEYDPVESVPVTFGERLQRTAADSFSSFVDFLQEFILGILWMIPFLLFLAVLVAIIVLIVLLATRKKRKLARELREQRLQAQKPAQLSDEEPGEK